MTTTADLLYLIKADATDFNKEFKKAAKGADSFGKKVRRSLNNVGKFALAGAGGIATLTQRAIDNIDQMQKWADASGLAAKDMGTLALAADLGGTSLAALTTTIGRLSKEARRGNKIFDELGISVRNSEGQLKPTLDLVEDVADTFERLGPGAEATALAYELFGRRGQELLPTLLQGRDNIRQLREEADRLGLTFDETTGRAAEQFNDNMTVLKRTVNAFFIQLASQVVPTLANYTNELRKGATRSDTLAKKTQFLGTVFKRILAGLEAVKATFQLVGLSAAAFGATIFSVFRNVFDVLKDTAQSGFDGIKALLSGDFDEAGDALATIPGKFRDAAKKAGTDVATIWKNFGEESTQIIFDSGNLIENILDGSFDKIEDTAKNTKPLKPIEDDVAKRAQAIEAWLKRLNDSFDRTFEQYESRAEAIFDETRTPLEKYREGVDELTDLFQGGLVSADTYLRKMRQLGDAYRDATKASKERTKSIKKELTDEQKFISDTASLIGRTFEDILFDPFDRNVEDMVRSFTTALGKMALRAATSKIFESLTTGGALGFAGGGLVSGPGTGRSDSIPAWLSRGEYVIPANIVDRYGRAFFDSLRAGTKKFAEGGSVGGESSVNLRVVNQISDDVIFGALNSPAGERVILNVIRRNDR